MQQFHLTRLIQLSLVAFCLTGVRYYSEAVCNNRELREQYDKIYANHEQILDPIKTLDLLKDFCEKLRDTEDEKLIVIRKHFQELIYVSEVSIEKCNNYYSSYEDTANLIKTEKAHPNVVTFLKDFRLKQFSICRTKLLDKLKHQVREVSDEVKNKLRILKESVISATRERPSELFREAYENDLVRASLTFMEKIIGPLKTKLVHNPRGHEEYASEFRNNFRTPCLMVVLKIFPTIRVYNLLSFEEDMLDLFDPLERDWLENYNVCSMMMENGTRSVDELIEKSYDLLDKDLTETDLADEQTRKFSTEKNRNNQSFWKKCAGCFGFHDDE